MLVKSGKLYNIQSFLSPPPPFNMLFLFMEKNKQILILLKKNCIFLSKRNSTVECIFKLYFLEWTIDVTSRNPPFKEGDPQFTTVPLKP